MSEVLRSLALNESKSSIKFKTNFRNTVLDSLKARGWKDTEGDDWDIIWADKEWIHEAYDQMHLKNHQRVNHYRNHYELTRKDNMARNIKKTKRELERNGKHAESAEFSIVPNTFILPLEYSMFVEDFKQQKPGTVWIMKPVGRAQGKGIFLLDKLSQLNDWKNGNTRTIYPNEKDKTQQAMAAQQQAQQGKRKEDKEEIPPEYYVCQRYLENPLLVGGKKFDLRIYCLVTSFRPLTAWFHRSGFARFSHTTYQKVETSNLSNVGMHLTNVAIQKTQDNYDAESGGKWEVDRVKRYLAAKYGWTAVERLFGDIQRLVIKSLQAVQKVMISDRHSFEMYGYDVIIDSDLKPWLLEVNASPSLTANTPDDYALKMALLDDVYSVLDVERVLHPVGLLTPTNLTNTQPAMQAQQSGNGAQTAALLAAEGVALQVGGFDLILKDDVEVRYGEQEATGIYSRLGTANDRETNYKSLAAEVKDRRERGVVVEEPQRGAGRR